MKKRFICMCLSALVMLGILMIPIGAGAEDDSIPTMIFTVNERLYTVDGVYDALDQPAQIIDSRLMLPMRVIFEGLGAQVDWDGKTVKASKGFQTIKMTAGESPAFINGQPQELDVPSQLVGDRLLVPVRFVSEALGIRVIWDEASGTVTLAPPIEKPDYVRFLVDTYDDIDQDYDISVINAQIHGANSEARYAAYYSALSYRLYQLTKDKKYLNRCVAYMEAMINTWMEDPSYIQKTYSDFFVNDPMLVAYEALKEEGLWKEEWDSTLRTAVTWFARMQKGDDNQGLSRAVGVARALRLFPDDPDAPKWKENLDYIWNYWYNNKDLNENGTHYNSIGLHQMIQLARLMGKEEDLKNDEIKKIFIRYRDQITPAGAMPEYGDDYYYTWLSWPYVMEYAARLYDDPTFLDAAWRTYWYGIQNFPVKRIVNNFSSAMRTFSETFFTSEILYLPEYEKPAQQTIANSAVTLRNQPGNPGAYNKFILGSSRVPGSPMIFSELYPKGFHGHLNKAGAIAHYEVDNKTIWHGLSRHMKSAVMSNSVAMMPENYEYPVGVAPRANEWVHESIPLRNLAPPDFSSPDEVLFDRYTIRLALNSGVQSGTFIIDNMRAVGPKGTIMIEDFEELSKWQRADQPYQLVNDATEGNSALQINLKPGAGYFYNAMKPENPSELFRYGKTINVKDYPMLKYDWKYVSDTDSMDFNFIFRMYDSGTDNEDIVDISISDINIRPNIMHAETNMQGLDSFGQIDMEEYGTYDTTLQRRMVLTQEGLLVIADTITPGADAEGYVAGPLWHHYSGTDKGENWFSSPGEPKDWKTVYQEEAADNWLMSYFAEAPGREFGVARAFVPSNKTDVADTSYVKQKLVPGEPITFVSVILTHAADTSPRKIAENISAQSPQTGAAAVSCILPDKNVRLAVQIDADGNWSVQRELANVSAGSFVKTADEITVRPLVTNGGFEEVNPLNKTAPMGWSPQKSGCSIDSTVVHSGNNAIRLEGNNADSWRGYRAANIPVEGGETYRIRMYYKTQNVGEKSYVGLSFGVLSSDGAWLISDSDPSTKVITGTLGTHDWEVLEGEYTVPEGGTFLTYFTPRLDAKTGGKEIAWFDDISVEKISQTATVSK